MGFLWKVKSLSVTTWEHSISMKNMSSNVSFNTIFKRDFDNCGRIKGNESDVANNDFVLCTKKSDKFLCFNSEYSHSSGLVTWDRIKSC